MFTNNIIINDGRDNNNLYSTHVFCGVTTSCCRRPQQFFIWKFPRRNMKKNPNSFRNDNWSRERERTEDVLSHFGWQLANGVVAGVDSKCKIVRSFGKRFACQMCNFGFRIQKHFCVNWMGTQRTKKNKKFEMNGVVVDHFSCVCDTRISKKKTK